MEPNDLATTVVVRVKATFGSWDRRRRIRPQETPLSGFIHRAQSPRIQQESTMSLSRMLHTMSLSRMLHSRRLILCRKTAKERDQIMMTTYSPKHGLITYQDAPQQLLKLYLRPNQIRHKEHHHG